MVDGAEPVRNPMLAPMPDEQKIARLELGAALRALPSQVDPAGLGRLAGLPVGALHCPWDHVLQAAEDGAAVALVLAQPIAVVRLDVGAAPRAAEVSRSR